MSISRIVSGGQTGADRAGLAAAIYAQVPHGGWCPKGRRAEDGRIPDEFELRETTSADYLVRTEANVVDSDATVVFTFGTLAGGSLRTAEFARKHGRPCLHVDLKATGRMKAADSIEGWLRGCPNPCVLNVAGSRGSKLPAWCEHLIMAVVVDVLISVNPGLRSVYPLPDAPTTRN